MHRAKWSERIHDEWMRNAIANNPKLNTEILTRTKALMNGAVLDCLVIDFDEIEASLHLPDEDDKHVLAAAIVSHADVIVTYNLKDFPKESLEKYGIQAQHPDVFLMHLIDLNHHKVINSMQSIIKRLKKTPIHYKPIFGQVRNFTLKGNRSILSKIFKTIVPIKLLIIYLILVCSEHTGCNEIVNGKYG